MTGRPPFTQLVGAYAAGAVIGPAAQGALALTLAVTAAAVATVRFRPRLLLLGALGAGVTSGVVAARVDAGTCARQWPPGAAVRAFVDVGDAPGAQRATTAEVRYAPEGCGGTIRLRGVPDLPAGGRAIVVGRHRIRGVVRVEHVRAVPGEPPWRFRIRHMVAQRIRTLYGPRAPFVEAVVIGRRDDLPSETRQAFVGAGLAHLLAISGLHVGIFALWVGMAARVAGLGRRADLVAVGAVWAYVALLGFPPPATRAGAFLSAAALSRRLQRHPSAGTILALGVVTVLTVDPSAARSVGAWLSVAAVWGVGRAVRLVGSVGRPGRAVLQLAAASLGATLATAPITAFAFGQVAPIGLAANLVGIPLAAVAVPGVLTSLVVGEIMAGGAGAVLWLLEAWVDLMTAVPGGSVAAPPGVAFDNRSVGFRWQRSRASSRCSGPLSP
jgi:ComEC/Rec2-related protein